MQPTQQTKEEQTPVTNNITVTIIEVPPVMHYKKFAELTGVSEGVVRGWMDKGLIPTRKQGRYRLIDIEQIKTRGLS